MNRENLLGGPPPTYLPEEAEAAAALRAGEAPATVAARFPAYSAAWATTTTRGSGTARAGAKRAPTPVRARETASRWRR